MSRLRQPAGEIIKYELDGHELLGRVERRYVYFFLAPKCNAVKIGSTVNISQRAQSLQTGNPERLQLLGVQEETPLVGEAALHQRFAHLCIRGEWYRYTREIKEHLACLPFLNWTPSEIRVQLDGVHAPTVAGLVAA